MNSGFREDTSIDNLSIHSVYDQTDKATTALKKDGTQPPSQLGLNSYKKVAQPQVVFDKPRDKSDLRYETEAVSRAIEM